MNQESPLSNYKAEKRYFYLLLTVSILGLTDIAFNSNGYGYVITGIVTAVVSIIFKFALLWIILAIVQYIKMNKAKKSLLN